MATTVTYKGQTLATVENQTKTLQTAGTWCEDDFTLTDVSGGGGGDDYLAQSLMNTLTSYSSDEVTSIAEKAFYGRTNLQTVSLPNVTSTGADIFYGCTSLTTLSVPKLKIIQNQFCRGCTSLADFDFSEITNLTNNHIFRYTSLTGVYAPKCTGVGTWGSCAFADCTDLEYFRAPLATGGMRQECFARDTALKLIDLGSVSNFSVGTNFSNCTSLEVLILRNTAVANLGNVNNFSGVTQNVSVYVPSALVSSYQSATNWSTLFNNGILTFYDLEGSPYEETDFVYMGVPA